jgi:hypothetical protein
MTDGRKKNGGARKGAGRKSVHDEIAARDIAIKAITSVYGSLEEGLIALLQTNEPSLQKFVFEHAIGKPADKVQHSSDPDYPVNFIIDARYKNTGQDNS